jgi:GNAT superfamily N-acetyltransferase
MDRVVIREATTARDWATMATLFRAYAASLPFSLYFQGFAEELARLPGDYAPPRGRGLIAEVDGESAGVVAMRPLESDIVEMKRMFVNPRFRGRDLGGALARAIVEAGRQAGYARMVLDTHATMTPAITLYRSLGFAPIERYNDNPMDDVLFLGLDLSPRKNRVAEATSWG